MNGCSSFGIPRWSCPELYLINWRIFHRNTKVYVTLAASFCVFKMIFRERRFWSCIRIMSCILFKSMDSSIENWKNKENRSFLSSLNLICYIMCIVRRRKFKKIMYNIIKLTSISFRQLLYSFKNRKLRIKNRRFSLQD